MLLATVEPESWKEAGTGEGSAVLLRDTALLVNQSQAVHEEIQKVFEQLRGGIEQHEE